MFHQINVDGSWAMKDHYSSDANLVLYEGDVNDFLAEVPDKSVKLILTSPPYNLGKE